MSTADLQVLVERAKAEPGLRAQLEAATSPDQVAAVAAEAGLSVTAQEVAGNGGAELNENDLDGVSGGTVNAGLFNLINGVGTYRPIQ